MRIGFSYVSYSLRLSFVRHCQQSKCGSKRGCRGLAVENAPAATTTTFFLRGFLLTLPIIFSSTPFFRQIVGKWWSLKRLLFTLLRISGLPLCEEPPFASDGNSFEEPLYEEFWNGSIKR